MILTRSSSLNRRNVPTSWHPWMWFVGSSWGLQFWDGIHQPVLVWGCRFFFGSENWTWHSPCFFGGDVLQESFNWHVVRKQPLETLWLGQSLSTCHEVGRQNLAFVTFFSHMKHAMKITRDLQSTKRMESNSLWCVEKTPCAKSAMNWDHPQRAHPQSSHLSGESWLIREMIPKWP